MGESKSKLKEKRVKRVARQMKEKKQQESEIMFRQLFESMSSGVAIYSTKDGNNFYIKNFNRAAEKIEHISRKQVIGKNVLKAFPGVKKFGIFKVFQRVWKTGKPEHFPVSLYKDKRIFGWRENYIYKIPNGDIIAIYDDVTEKKKIEDNFSESELRYRRLFETAQDGVLLIDFTTGMILDVNPFLINMLGYSKKDFLKKYLWEVGVFKDVAASRDNFKTLQKKKYVRFEDLPLETKSGEKIDVEFVANAYRIDSKIIIQCNIRDITIRKKAEREQSESNKRYRDFFEISQDCVFIATESSKWIDCNNYAVKMFGFSSRKALMEVPISSLFVDQRERSIFLALVKRRGYVKEYPVQLKRKNGEIMDALITIGIRRSKNNLENEFFGTIHDITNRKKLETKLLESEEKFFKAFYTSPYAITITRMKDGKFIDVNNTFSFISGFTHKEALNNSSVGMNLWVNKKDREYVMRKIRSGHKVVDEEFLFRMKKGEILTGMFSAQTIQLGQETCLLSSIADITDRKRAEEALHETEERFRIAFELSKDGLLIVDKNDAKILNFNKAAQDLFGYSKDEFLKKKLWEIGGVKNKDDFQGAALILKKENVVYYKDVLIKTKKGLSVSADISLINGPKFFQCNIRDITKEKEIEKMRNDFLSLASHQLRTPLSGTKWLIETMNSGVIGKVTEKQKKYLSDIYKINERMITLVSDILKTLRLSSEEIIVKKEKIPIHFIFKGIMDLVVAAAEGKKVTLECPLDHRTLIVKTDGSLVKSILGSFVSNAIDYSMPGQKVILDFKEEDKAIVFFVRDFGIGIPKSEKERIFERFYRASNAKDFKPTGTGLGLNISKMLAERIGGEVSFESKEGEGSIFYLRIPKNGHV